MEICIPVLPFVKQSSIDEYSVNIFVHFKWDYNKGHFY